MASISIILPIYNVAQYLDRCLNSILDQTFSDWNAILVNDGSTDNSLEIAERFAAKDSRFVIINKKNGGLGDARNAGILHADGEYIMFVDSDDFIHPQTCEIAIALAKKTGSDIVSWKRDPLYKLFIKQRRRIFGTSESKLIASKPFGYNRRYNIDNIKYTYTGNLLKYVTEDSTTHESPRIKGAYVWRHLFKREVIKDIPFVKGLKYEDFPWWNEVILQNPTATITTLPLYYYYPNKKSITHTVDNIEWLKHWSIGLEKSYLDYKERATPNQMHLWSKNIKWNAISSIVRRMEKIDEEDKALVAQILGRMAKTGIFEDAKKYNCDKQAAFIHRLIETY